MVIIKKFISVIPFLLVAVLLLVSVKGLAGNPTERELNQKKWTTQGPFTLSPERGRFALLYSLVENKSFYFSVDLARFAIPDLGYKNGHYVSLFAPAVSFVAVPGYLLGKTFGLSQVGAFATSSLFALLNFLLISKIAGHLSRNKIAGFVSGLVFLFATPAFAYAGVLYQHHLSTFLILLSLYILMFTRKSVWLFLVFLLCAASIPIDYPNLVMMFPIGLFTLGKLISVHFKNHVLNLKFQFRATLTLFGVIPPLLFFLWFNFRSYNNPLQFSGTVPGVREIDAEGKPAVPAKSAALADPEKYLKPELQQKSATGFFRTRNFINGLYIHIFSPDRGLIYFTPVILLALSGYWFLWHLRDPYLPLLAAIPLAGFALYSMWGDPWGGWAFGSRYMIPAYAIFAVVLAPSLASLSKNIPFIILFAALFVYSAAASLTGALTTIANPPQVEAGSLGQLSGRVERFSWDRNWENLQNGSLSSYVYNSLLRPYVKPVPFYWLILAVISLMGVTPVLWLKLKFR